METAFLFTTQPLFLDSLTRAFDTGLLWLIQPRIPTNMMMGQRKLVLNGRRHPLAGLERVWPPAGLQWVRPPAGLEWVPPPAGLEPAQASSEAAQANVERMDEPSNSNQQLPTSTTHLLDQEHIASTETRQPTRQNPRIISLFIFGLLSGLGGILSDRGLQALNEGDYHKTVHFINLITFLYLLLYLCMVLLRRPKTD